EIIDSRVVAHDGQIFCAFQAQRGNQIFGNAAQPESANQDGHAVGQFFDGRGSRSDSFVHETSRPIPSRTSPALKTAKQFVKFVGGVKIAFQLTRGKFLSQLVQSPRKDI